MEAAPAGIAFSSVAGVPPTHRSGRADLLHDGASKCGGSFVGPATASSFAPVILPEGNREKSLPEGAAPWVAFACAVAAGIWRHSGSRQLSVSSRGHRVGGGRTSWRRARTIALGSSAAASDSSSTNKKGFLGLDRFQRLRLITFAGMVAGYAVYYFTRLSFNYVGIGMRSELGLTMLQLGSISSLFPLAYMNSKFISGILSDALGSPVLIFGLGLTMTGVLNILFASGSSLPWFTAVWVVNGLFQGCGATPCNKMLVNWYPSESRGKWWSGWNASHNIGGFLIPLLAGGLTASYGWRYGMFAPGVIAIFVGLACLCVMKDGPEKCGLPSAEDYYAASRSSESEALGSTTAEPNQDEEEEPKQGVWKMLFANRFLWCMAFMHFFVYLIRQGVLNWAHFYIIDEFGVSAAEATARVSGFELGGLFGCIVSGQVSDWLISKRPEAGAAGLRTQVMVIYQLLATVSVLGLWLLPPVAVLQWLSMALFGFAIYGPQTLITMTGVETVPKRAAATAGGILAYPAQFGSMFAGLPFAFLVQRFGWKGFFPSLVVISLIATAVALPGMSTPSYIQVRDRARKAKAARAE